MMLRFYLTVAGATATAVGYLWVSKEYLLSALLSLFGAIASISFRRLDQRVANLVKLGENALSVFQAEIATTLGAPQFEICKLANEKKDTKGRKFIYPYSYGENFRLLFALAALIFLVMAGVSAFHLKDAAEAAFEAFLVQIQT